MWALVGDIARGSTVDGPGLRTTVFFKGCPLRCPWCHNPELRERRPELLVALSRCIGCGACAGVCQAGAIAQATAPRVVRQRCLGCGTCVTACPAGARRLVGRRHDVGELLALLERDRVFYDVSGGGVTLSGGEPTVWPDFVTALTRELKERGIGVALETCGLFAWARCERLLSDVDGVMFDLKIADPRRHETVLGSDNRVILENLGRLLASRPDDTVVRIPIIPGHTDDEANLVGLAGILRPLRPRRVVLLPWHPFGLGKAEAAGRHVDPSMPRHSLPRERLERWLDRFSWTDAAAPGRRSEVQVESSPRRPQNTSDAGSAQPCAGWITSRIRGGFEPRRQEL